MRVNKIPEGRLDSSNTRKLESTVTCLVQRQRACHNQPDFQTVEINYIYNAHLLQAVCMLCASPTNIVSFVFESLGIAEPLKVNHVGVQREP